MSRAPKTSVATALAKVAAEVDECEKALEAARRKRIAAMVFAHEDGLTVTAIAEIVGMRRESTSRLIHTVLEQEAKKP